MKYGGLKGHYELAKRALEAIDRIETPMLAGLELTEFDRSPLTSSASQERQLEAGPS